MAKAVVDAARCLADTELRSEQDNEAMMTEKQRKVLEAAQWKKEMQNRLD